MLLAVFLSIILGIASSYTGIISVSMEGLFNELPFYILCAMLFIVGYGVGKDKQALRSLLKGSVKMFMIPLGTIAGAIIAGIVASFFLEQSAREAIAVACGMGWYSYTPIYITEVYSAELGAVSFVSDVFREVFTFLLFPLALKIFGKYPAISIGGATTMDVTLPIITKYADNDTVVAAFIHGAIISLIIPVLIPLVMIGM